MAVGKGEGKPVRPLSGQALLVSTSRDVTERSRAELTQTLYIRSSYELCACRLIRICHRSPEIDVDGARRKNRFLEFIDYFLASTKPGEMIFPAIVEKVVN